MQDHPNHSSLPWGFRAVSGFDLVCRVGIPAVNDLDALIYEPQWLNYEYDFIQEHQAVADHDQYMEMLRFTSAPQPTNTTHEVNSSIAPGCQITTRHSDSITTAIGGASEHIVYPSRHSEVGVPCASQPQVITVPEPDPQSLPKASTHILSGKVLEPIRHEPKQPSSRLDPASVPVNNTIQFNTDQERMLRQYFDSDLNDPFASMELSAMNDREELRKVLSSSDIPAVNNLVHTNGAKTNVVMYNQGQSASPTVHLSSQYTHVPLASTASSISYGTSPGIPGPLQANRLPSPAIPPTSLPPQSFPGRSYYDHPLPPSSSSYTSAATTSTIGGYSADPVAYKSLQPNHETAPRSTSFPDLKAALTSPQYYSRVPATGPAMVSASRPINTASTPTTSTVGMRTLDGIRTPMNTRFVLPTQPVLDELRVRLVSWANKAGYPEARARYLIYHPGNKSYIAQQRMFQSTCELVGHQLRSVELLISTTVLNSSEPGGGVHGRLSESAAIAAVAAFPHDINKARDFAKSVEAMHQQQQ